MKFGQLIEYNMRSIFLEKSYTKSGAESIPKPFSKKSKLNTQFVFIVCQVEDYENILKLSCRALTFTLYKAFLKNKKSAGTSLAASFSA